MGKTEDILTELLGIEMELQDVEDTRFMRGGDSLNYYMKKIVKLEVYCGQRESLPNSKTSKRGKSHGLEVKLDDLRKELASTDGGIFPQYDFIHSANRHTEEVESIIGKLKTEKYRRKINEEIEKYESDQRMDDELTGRAAKKLKTKKAFIVVESSEDEV